MTGFSQDSLMMLLRIAVVPILLITIYLRNRAVRRRRAAQAASPAPDAPPPLPPIDPDTAEEAQLRAALGRARAGDRVTSNRGEALTRWQLAGALAALLLSQGRQDAAEDVLQGVQAAAEPGRWPALLQLARVWATAGQGDAARALLAEAAELRLAMMRSSARGDPLHLAELLAEDPPHPRDLHDPALARAGPLCWLVLAGRDGDARALVRTLLPRLDRALAESAGDPTGKVDGFPRPLLADLRQRLAATGAPGDVVSGPGCGGLGTGQSPTAALSPAPDTARRNTP
ncbi:hypothetical protein DZD18_13410 [Rhodobacteraceae bacterium W635]|uniref:hypothetical protein n=1 Tax=Nioella halotolerans TaxID=2303578 RepID=UPI000E3EC372|nr:hypothetical protein DZD18_13410 [Rhodobacteraceae bacterium W635]